MSSGGLTHQLFESFSEEHREAMKIQGCPGVSTNETSIVYLELFVRTLLLTALQSFLHCFPLGILHVFAPHVSLSKPGRSRNTCRARQYRLGHRTDLCHNVSLQEALTPGSTGRSWEELPCFHRRPMWAPGGHQVGTMWA